VQKNKKISRLTLGTVQLGLEYGIANQTGKPTTETAYEILQKAVDAGVAHFDTAPLYGNSETIIGNFLGKLSQSHPHPVVITKIPSLSLPSGSSFQTVFQAVKTSIQKSAHHLKLSQIPICLLHGGDGITAHCGRVVDSLIRLKEDGLIGRIGASVYSCQEVEAFLNVADFDVIQIPMNLFDRRIANAGLLADLIERNISIFARSIFLQGLFFIDPKRLPAHLAVAYKPLTQLRDLCTTYGMRIDQAAVVYVRDCLLVDSLVIGVETVGQLQHNLELMQGAPMPKEMTECINALFGNLPEALIWPYLWTLKEKTL